MWTKTNVPALVERMYERITLKPVNNMEQKHTLIFSQLLFKVNKSFLHHNIGLLIKLLCCLPSHFQLDIQRTRQSNMAKLLQNHNWIELD